MKRFTHIIVLSCKTATRLIEKKLHTRLSTKERIQLKLHKSICDICTLYEKQVIYLDKVLKNDSSKIEAEQAFPAEEVEALQAKIINSIEK